MCYELVQLITFTETIKEGSWRCVHNHLHFLPLKFPTLIVHEVCVELHRRQIVQHIALLQRSSQHTRLKVRYASHRDIRCLIPHQTRLEFAFGIYRRVLVMQPVPDPCKESFLAAKLHFCTLLVMSLSQLVQCVSHFLRTLPAAHHVVMKNIQCLGSV